MKLSLSFFVYLLATLSLSAQDWHLYLGDTEMNHVRRMTADGSEMEELFTINTVREIEMDEPNGKFWYIDADLEEICKRNYDGTGLEVVIGNLGNPNSLFLDHKNERFFYSDAADSSLHVVDWDGTNDFTIIQGEGRVTHVEYDYCTETLYWADFENSRIARVKVDGSGLEDAVSNIILPKDFEIDVLNQKLYWVTSDLDAMVVRADLDGSNAELIYELNSGAYASIELDHENEKLYVLEQGSQQLVWMNLDGSDPEILSENFVVVGQLGVISCEPMSHCEEVDWCSNMGYVFGDDTLYESGHYFDYFDMGAECDSVSVLDLNVQNPVDPGIQPSYDVEIGETLTIVLGAEFEDVVWSDGTEGNVFQLDTSDMESGQYTFTYTASSTIHGCDLFGSFVVNVDRASDIDDLDPGLGLSLYPNPIQSGEKLNIQFSNTGYHLTQYQWVSLSGHSLGIVRNRSSQIAVPNSPGLYVLNVYLADGGVVSRKVVVE